MLILEMQKQMRIRNHFFTLEEIRPNTEKNAKIRTLLQPRYASHSILHSAFMKDLEAELLKFPNGKHDDMIDALSGCIQMFQTVNIDSEWS
jgi:phage terminase large subunit-like protein